MAKETSSDDANAGLSPNRSYSTFAPALNQVRASTRRRLGVGDEALVIWDVIVSGIATLVDDDDGRTPTQKIEELVDRQFPEGLPEREMELYLARFTSMANDGLPSWIRKMQHAGGKRFLRRVLGSAQYDELDAALKKDLAIIGLGLRRGLRAAMPYISALDSAWSFLPEAQRKEFSNLGKVETVFLEMLLDVDAALERIVDASLLEGLLEARPDEVEALRKDDFASLARTMREIVAGRAHVTASGLGNVVTRKIDGAKAALEYSPDAVSQAANSLIELLDRLLRAAFTDDEVLAWTKTNYGDWKEMTYVTPDGRERPTKKAQALCFSYAGAVVQQRQVLNELAAVSLREARSQLQRYKHADSATPAEKLAILSVMDVINSFIHYVIGFVWAQSAADGIERLRRSLADP
ncbi:hypothetical protein WDV85_16565 [Pseudokineococcus sp. 5B2Z-1]|uniref:hypothetical protein n=1 Tax=Pseudokineococcus sp. 5B2Z-1 TaxID=3132744 RepID=UPI0030986398